MINDVTLQKKKARGRHTKHGARTHSAECVRLCFTWVSSVQGFRGNEWKPSLFSQRSLSLFQSPLYTNSARPNVQCLFSSIKPSVIESGKHSCVFLFAKHGDTNALGKVFIYLADQNRQIIDPWRTHGNFSASSKTKIKFTLVPIPCQTFFPSLFSIQSFV